MSLTTPQAGYLNAIANKLINKTLKNIDKSKQLQTTIHPEIYFRYNSINLLISCRGVGKTFTVMKELIKLSQLPDKRKYTTFLYVSDKTNDCTVNELINLIKLNVKIVSYEDALAVLSDIIDAKSVYENALNKGLEDELTEKCKNEIFKILGLMIGQMRFHTPLYYWMMP
jgi:hypothetical protein